MEGGVVAIFHESMKINKRVIFFGDGKQTRDWVHVYDIVNAFIKSLNYKLKSGVFTLGSAKKTKLIDAKTIVYDNIYKPVNTELIKDAKKKKAQIIYGYEMLLAQAAKSFEIWLKQKAPYEIMKKSILGGF